MTLTLKKYPPAVTAVCLPGLCLPGMVLPEHGSAAQLVLSEDGTHHVGQTLQGALQHPASPTLQGTLQLLCHQLAGGSHPQAQGEWSLLRDFIYLKVGRVRGQHRVFILQQHTPHACSTGRICMEPIASTLVCTNPKGHDPGRGNGM